MSTTAVRRPPSRPRLPSLGQPSRRRPALEIWLALAVSVLVAAGMNWPVLARLGSTVPGTGVDPFIELWSLGWSGHALAPGGPLFGPGAVFSGNAFYPAPDSLAFTDSLLGLGPVTWPFGAGQLAAAFGVCFVLGSALSSAGAYALARQLGAHWLGAAVAGAAFAYAPWRLGQLGHLHVLTTGPMVLALAMLARGHGLRWTGRPGPRRPLWIALGWAAACWQISVGFAGGLPFGYLLLLIGLALCVLIAVRAWSGRPAAIRWPIPWPVLVTDLAGGLAFAATGLAMAVPYLRVQDVEAAAIESARGVDQVRMYSPDWSGLVTPPAMPGSWSWLTGGATLSPGTSEARVLPGVVLLVLAVLGILVSRWSWRWRALLVLSVLGSGVLVLGTTVWIAGHSPFLALRNHLPGWASDRTPGRLIVFTTLALALLAAGAVTALVDWSRRRLAGSGLADSGLAGSGLAGSRVPGWAFLPVLLVALVLAEGYGRVPVTRVPAMPAAVRAAPGPMVVLPSVWTYDSVIMYWTALRGFPEVANGASGITPQPLKFMRAQMLRFPDQRSVTYLRSHGFASVVVMKRDFGRVRWAGAAAIPAPELGLTRTDLGDSILYTLSPPP